MNDVEEVKGELLRVRERLHEVADAVNRVNLVVAKFSHVDESLKSLSATIDSLTKSVIANTTDVLQRLTSSERWQAAHEKMDDERWRHLGVKMQEMQDTMEAIPVEVGKDLGRIEVAMKADHEKVEDHDAVLMQVAGGRKVFVVVAGLAGTALVVMNIWHILSHGI